MSVQSSGQAAPSLIAMGALLVNAAVWGLSWIPFRSLSQQDIHPLWSTAIIYAASTAVMIYLCRHDFRTIRQQRLLWVLCAAAGLTNACFNTAVATGDVVRVILLFYLMPVWTIVLARLILQEPLTPHSLLKVSTGLAGAGVVIGPTALSMDAGLGWSDALAVAGGVLFALNNVLLRRLHPLPGRLGTLAMVSGGCIMGSFTAVTWTVISQQPWPVALQTAGPWPTLLLWSGLFMMANACLQFGASRLPAVVTSVLMLSEILFGSVSAWLLGQAQIGVREVAGGLLIALAALLPGSSARSAD